MARWIGPGPEHNIEAVLEAAATWKDRCFLSDGSVFSDRKLWTLENLRELEQRVVYGAIEGKHLTFIQKLEKQLEGAAAEVVHLAVEVYWFFSLFPSRQDIRPRTKRRNMNQIWAWSRSEFPTSKYLDDAVLGGVARTGISFKARGGWEQIKFLLQVVCRWKERPRYDKTFRELPPFDLADWVDRIEDAEYRGMRNALLYLLHPDFFEAISSGLRKQEILTALKERLPERLRSMGEDAPTAQVDRALHELRNLFEKDYGTSELDFHRSPLLELWEPPILPGRPTALNTILYGPPGTGKTYATARRCVEICDQASQQPDKFRERYDELVDEGRVEFVTFHQTYGYEEFVEGLRPETGPANNSADSAGFRVVPTDGVLKRIAGRARKSIDLNHVLVIDEVNRANVSKVLGELITVLEEDKRQDAENEVCVTLPYSGERFTLPSNLYIVATMNTADRSIALLDTALRRRFEFEELAPEPELLEDAAKAAGVALADVLNAINERLEWLIDRDHLIGHAWLMDTKSRDDLDRTMRRKIIPLIAEYFYDDWDKVRAVLGGTDDFVERATLAVPPSLDDSAADEPRYRWTVKDEFSTDAYTRLIGKSAQSGDAEPT